MTTAINPPCDEGVIRSKEGATPCRRNVGRWLLAATIIGSSIALIDGTVVNEVLNASVRDVQWQEV